MIIGYLISRVERFLIYNEARHMEDTEENEINYLKKIFRYRMGEELDLINPESFNQKIQWLSYMIEIQSIQSWLINMK